MPKKRVPAIANCSVWETVTKRRAEIRWDNVVDKVWKEVGGNQEDIMSPEKYAEYQAKLNEWMERRERLVLRKKVKEEEHSEIYGRLIEEIRMKMCLHGPIDYTKTLKLRFRERDLDPPETQE